MADENIFASVVVPCYNSRRTLGECLASLESQTCPREHYEIIVADNGSNDGSPEFIASSFPRVRIVHAEQKGSGYARNAGIWAAAGQVILSTDADCVPEPNWIEMLLDAFQKTPPGTAAIGGRIVPYSLATFVEKYRPAWVQQPDAEGPEAKARYAATPNAAFRTEAIRGIGGFDGTLGFDDTDLGMRFIEGGFGIVQTDKAIVRHRNPATLSELYRHRVKYGEFSFTLARKHPGVFGDPLLPGKRAQLFRETVRRVIGDCVKLPISTVRRSEGPVGWPIIDAVLAIANYQGFARGASRAR